MKSINKIILLFLIIVIILLSIIIYQHTPRYQYKIKNGIEKEEFKKTQEALKGISEGIKKHNEAVREKYK